MEPRNGPAEQAPQLPQPEQWNFPGAPDGSSGAERAPEQREQQMPALEQPHNARKIEVQTYVPTTTLPAPQVDDPADGSSATVSDDDAPLVAADEDVIEKEWVDKAKKIISDTKDDPFQREQQIKKLQVEYIRKRYGREVGERVD